MRGARGPRGLLRVLRGLRDLAPRPLHRHRPRGGHQARHRLRLVLQPVQVEARDRLSNSL